VAEQDDVVASTSAGASGENILSIISADSGWRAIYGGGSAGDESGLSRVVAWALVEDDTGERRIVGLVVDPQNRSNIVTATGTESSQAGTLTGYGYKER
jgi:hypothetical protein